MPLNLLDIKYITPPEKSKTVYRSELFSKLDNGISLKLILVSAPAGFGKSTLISDWIRKSNLIFPLTNISDSNKEKSDLYRIAWVSLDEGDNDLNSFISYIIAALQKIDSSIGSTVVSAFQSPQSPDIDTILHSLINDFTRLPIRILIVLDDYHLVHNKEIHKFLKFIIEYLPKNITLLISTRTDPFLPLSRMRAAGDIIELREKELRFSIKETSEFFSRTMGLNLSENQINKLENRTEGWIAGLQLAALSLNNYSEYSEFIDTFSGDNKYIIDYLIDEVLSKQTDTIQKFLLTTSILKKFNHSLCNFLLRVEDSQEVIEYLEKSNLFIIPFDNQRNWYRYHHLFGDLLINRLRKINAGSIPELYSRASDWCYENEMIAEAIKYAVKAKNLTKAVELLKNGALTYLSQGRIFEISTWFELLPESVIKPEPWLKIYYAWILLFRGKLDELESILFEIENSNQDEDLLGNLYAIRGSVACTTNNFQNALEYANKANRLLPEHSIWAVSVTKWVEGFTNRIFGNLEEAKTAFLLVVKYGQVMNNLWTISMGMTDVGSVWMAMGKIQKAEGQYRQAIEFAEQQDKQNLGFIGRIEAALAYSLYEQNRLTEAYEYSQSGLEKIRNWENPNYYIFAYNIKIKVLLSWNKINEAELIFRKIDKILDNFQVIPYLVTAINSSRIRMFKLQENNNKLDVLLKDIQEKQENPRVLFNIAQIFNIQNKYEQAAKLLSELEQQAENKGWISFQIEILLQLVISFVSLNETDKALSFFEKSSELAESGYHIRSFLDAGLPVQNFSGKIIKNTKQTENVPDNMLDTYEVNLSVPKDDSLTCQYLTESLSRREIEVLQQLKTSLTGPEIAEQLFISLSTVRTHIKNIYAKLDVKNRREAVIKAFELNL
jgi:ATP/maltotriose-dependent transcriptional regulator MalT